MEEKPNFRTYTPAVILSIVLFIGVFIAFQSAKSRPSSIVLPGGITYLGPSPSPRISPISQSSHIPVSSDAKWVERKGALFPYTFMYPETLNLGMFPNDPYDSLTVFYEGTDANANIFFRIEDLNKLNKSSYIGKPKEYAQNWWKDYAWKGVANVSEFTNSKGLRGFRAKYLNEKGETPYDHVFFEVPNRKDLIIWISGKLFDQPVLDTMVDAVTWTK